MINRYIGSGMGTIWTEKNKFEIWLEVELLNCEALNSLGIVSDDEIEQLRAKASFDVERIYELEMILKHDVISFTRSVAETLGPERKWIHYGLTSTDVVDTSLGYLLKQANEMIMTGLTNLLEVIRAKAIFYKDTLMIGRTHGVHAEPITFGFKLALWYEEMQRNLKRLRNAAREVEVGKISGAVGTYANVNPFVEKYVCEQLGLEPAPISSQTLQRDRHAHYLSTLALLATSIEKMATEIRGLQKTEVRELEEFFSNGQKGSSAMPHKRNPIGSENLSGLARVMRGYMLTAYENVSLWHERDISHSSAERIILPDATILIDYMLTRFIDILTNLNVNSEQMLNNMEKTYGLIFSQQVLLKLVDKNIVRERAYDMIQRHANIAWKSQIPLISLLQNDPEIMEHLTLEELQSCFAAKAHLKHIDDIFNKLGL